MMQFQRMIVIPQEEYLTLSNVHNTNHPISHQFHDLSRQYTEEEKIRDPYSRLLQQSSTLDQLKQLKEEMRNNLKISTPKPYQNRAQALFKSIENIIRFNDKGEIIDNQGQIISHSRIEDLIQHAVRDRRRNMMPIGWSYFVNLLHDHNIPKSILNRSTLDELENPSPTPSPATVKAETLSPSMQSIKKVKEKMKTRNQPKRETKKNIDFLKSFK